MGWLHRLRTLGKWASDPVSDRFEAR